MTSFDLFYFDRLKRQERQRQKKARAREIVRHIAIKGMPMLYMAFVVGYFATGMYFHGI
jgi:hypothetical protein